MAPTAKAADTIRYNSNTSELQVIELLESHVRIIKSRKNNYFFQKLPSFVIFDIRALWRSVLGVRVHWASECPDVKNYKWRLNPVWHRMLYSCTHMATVGFKGLNWDCLLQWPTAWVCHMWKLKPHICFGFQHIILYIWHFWNKRVNCSAM